MFEMKKIAAVGIVMAAVSGAAYAGPAWEFTTPGNSYTDGTWDFATAFTANSAVTVSGLGYYADPVTGNADGNAVALYECADVDCMTTGTLLATATVTNVYPLTGHFRYVTIAPITLTPGMSYEVAGVSNVDNYTWNDPGFAVDPAITLVSDMSGATTRWQMLSTPDFLNYINYAEIEPDGFWGPNVFLGQPTFTNGVPEPATLALFGAGLAGFAAARRRKAKKAA